MCKKTSPIEPGMSLIIRTSDTLVLRHTGGGDIVEVGKNETLEDVVERLEALKTQQAAEPPFRGPLAQYQKSRDGQEGRVELAGSTAAPRRSIDAMQIQQKRQKRRQARHAKLPHFPILPDSVIGEDALEERKVNENAILSMARQT